MDQNIDRQKKKKTRKVIGIVAAAVLLVLAGAALGVGVMEKKMSDSMKEIVKEKGATEDYLDYIKLGKYKGLSVSIAATEEEIQSEIDSLLEKYTTYEQIKKGKAVSGDLVYMEFEGFVDGTKTDDLCEADYVEIGSGDWSWLPGLEDALIGMKPGGKKKITVDIPDGATGMDSVDGRRAELHIQLKYICGDAIIPEYNDEFVESISEYSTTKEYNAKIKADLEKDYEEEKEEYSWTDALENAKVRKYPKRLMEIAEQEVLEGYYGMAEIYGISRDEAFQMMAGCENEQEFRDTQLEELARDTVKEILFANAVAYQEKIKYTDADYDAVVEEEYPKYEDEYDTKEAYEKEHKAHLENLALIEAVKQWISGQTTYTK